MPTEPEMCAMIAREVMGWHQDGGIWMDGGGNPQHYVSRWNPYTDVAAAMEVLYRVQEWRWSAFVIEMQDVIEQRIGGMCPLGRFWRYFHHTDIAPAVVRVLEQEGEKDAD